MLSVVTTDEGVDNTLISEKMRASFKVVKITLPDEKFGGVRQIGIKFVTSCHFLVHNCQHLLLKLSGDERCFLDFLAEHMDNRNWLRVDKKLKTDFIQFLEEITSNNQTISARSLENYLRKFVDFGLVLKSSEASAGYYINPKYFFKGSQKDRENTIKALFKLASKGVVPYKPLLDKPLSEYFEDENKK